jgi:hypothetical protein
LPLWPGKRGRQIFPGNKSGIHAISRISPGFLRDKPHFSGRAGEANLTTRPLSPGMVNDRSITSRLSVGLPKYEIRHPIGSVPLEVKLEPIRTGSDEFKIGFRSDIKASKPI